MTYGAIAGLYAITPDVADTATLLAMTNEALGGGAQMVQYRNKTADTLVRVEQASLLANLCRQAAVPFIINDHADLAVELDADGVHLGQKDVSIAEARRRLGQGKIVGVSCYNELEHALEAERQGADYIAFGAFFASATKPGAKGASLDLLLQAKRTLHIPVVAIGGINLTNAAELIRHGADALAVINAVFGARNVRCAAEKISRLFRVKQFTAHQGLSNDLA